MHSIQVPAIVDKQKEADAHVGQTTRYVLQCLDPNGWLRASFERVKVTGGAGTRIVASDGESDERVLPWEVRVAFSGYVQ